MSLEQVAFPCVDTCLLWISINLGKTLHSVRPVKVVIEE